MGDDAVSPAAIAVRSPDGRTTAFFKWCDATDVRVRTGSQTSLRRSASARAWRRERAARLVRQAIEPRCGLDGHQGRRLKSSVQCCSTPASSARRGESGGRGRRIRQSRLRREEPDRADAAMASGGRDTAVPTTAARNVGARARAAVGLRRDLASSKLTSPMGSSTGLPHRGRCQASAAGVRGESVVE